MNLRKKSRNLITGALGVSAMIALPVTSWADDAPSAQVTYAKDVAPIMYSRCTECHRQGQIGPMSLLNFEETRPWAKSIKKTVAAKTMPPWFADPQYGHFKNDANLTEAEIKTIVSWVDQGAPSGDLSKAPPQPTYAEGGYGIGVPDEVFKMAPYTVSDDLEDHYEHVIVENPNTEDKWISSTEIRPGNKTMVHHVLVFLIPKGKQVRNLFEDPSVFMSMNFVTGWAPGTNALNYPESYGKLLPANSNVLLQIHYHKTPGPGTGGVDQSEFAVKYAKTPVTNPTTTAWVMDPTIRIPAGEPRYESISSFKFVDSGKILGLVPHMHLRGTDFMFEAEYPDGSKEILLSVPKWDFNWQIAYTMAEPKVMPKGTVVRAIAHWDNSAANPNNPDPNQDVYFGEATTEEMMIGFMEYSYDNYKKQQGKFGLPETMKGAMGAFFGGPSAGDNQGSEFKKRFDERLEKRKREYSAPQGQ